MAAVLEVDPGRAREWATTPSSAGRIALAWAAPHLADEGLQRQIFEQLSHDPEPSVRSTVARALRYRSTLLGWRTGIALRLVTADRDLATLAEVLQSLAERKPPGRLGDDEVQQVQAVLLVAATDPQRDESQVGAALQAFDELGHDFLWSWIWARLAALSQSRVPIRQLIEALPDSVMTMVVTHADAVGSEQQVARALAMLEQADLDDPRVEQALVRIVVDLGHPDLITDQLRIWARGSQRQRHHLYELLQRVRDPVRFERYAAAVLAGDSSPETIDRVIFAREPTSFMGSRVPYYEAAKKQFESWKAHSDGNLVRAALRAEQFFDDRIAEARAEESRRQEGYSL
jgi:hypothetical protein